MIQLAYNGRKGLGGMYPLVKMETPERAKEVDEVELHFVFSEVTLTIPEHWGFSQDDIDSLYDALQPVYDNFCIETADSAAYRLEYVSNGRFNKADAAWAFGELTERVAPIIHSAIIKHALLQPLD